MPTFKQWLFALLGVVFLNTNAVGAHLHLCFDGSEQPSSLHVLDGPGRDHNAAGSKNHHDVDVELTGQALAKTFKSDSLSPALPAFWTAPLVIRATSHALPVDAVISWTSSSRSFLPPLRGPPV